MTILGHISIVRVFFESFISDTTTLMIREDVLRSLTFIDQETLLCFKHETYILDIHISFEKFSTQSADVLQRIYRLTDL